MAVFINIAAEETKYIGRQKCINVFLTVPNTLINRKEESCALVFTGFAASVLYIVENCVSSLLFVYFFSVVPVIVFFHNQTN